MYLNIPVIFIEWYRKTISSNVPFVTIMITVLPGKVSKLRSIAELRAFDGMFLVHYKGRHVFV
jgi:hypothetical protein